MHGNINGDDGDVDVESAEFRMQQQSSAVRHNLSLSSSLNRYSSSSPAGRNHSNNMSYKESTGFRQTGSINNNRSTGRVGLKVGLKVRDKVGNEEGEAVGVEGQKEVYLESVFRGGRSGRSMLRNESVILAKEMVLNEEERKALQQLKE
jgi:hypothetical protein